ncbi:GIY-YIG nuclease family protein [Longimicrobium sp.]|uniref:GIY-YIG nuclease family protein n=1 Tax=Longimicrobium sp. TaxID=2029185 RepID=UPI002E31E88D|nr:GIY-YIG nuclease family protein [Longimicrobium sp.]HEX6040621.1 GIY-YIG nuclease family protein [Longimicrobium sp.]
MNKRALIRAYKETPRPMGIYRVHNTVADRSLVRQSVDLPSALNRERTQLKFGGHPVKALQADWNALGPDAFVFEVLDTLTPDDAPGYDPSGDLAVLESMWLERLQPFAPAGYTPAPRR